MFNRPPFKLRSEPSTSVTTSSTASSAGNDSSKVSVSVARNHLSLDARHRKECRATLSLQRQHTQLLRCAAKPGRKIMHSSDAGPLPHREPTPETATAVTTSGASHWKDISRKKLFIVPAT